MFMLLVYIKIIFWFSLQEAMLKKGFAWHYTAYDKRPELSKASYIFISFSITRVRQM